MHITRNGRVRRTEQEWRELIDLCRQSGLTQRQFCREHSVSLASFHRWAMRLESSSSPFVEIEAPHAIVAPKGEATSSKPSRWIVELILPHGCVLRIGA